MSMPVTGYTRTELTDRACERGVPHHLIEGLVEYIVDGRPTGRFLHALLENDFMETYSPADVPSAAGMPALFTFLYNGAPSGCFGSPEIVRGWYEKHAAARTAAAPQR